MIIPIRNEKEIEKMRRAGKALVEVFKTVGPLVAPGITTLELNAEIEKKIRDLGATAPCKGYHGYPAAACISIDDVVVHGIPSLRRLAEGEIVSVDIVLKLDGYNADATRTYAGRTDKRGKAAPYRRDPPLLLQRRREDKSGRASGRCAARDTDDRGARRLRRRPRDDGPRHRT